MSKDKNRGVWYRDKQKGVIILLDEEYNKIGEIAPRFL